MNRFVTASSRSYPKLVDVIRLVTLLGISIPKTVDKLY